MSDILFDRDEYRFSYRVGGLLIRDNRVLMQKLVGEEGYAVPGGHVAFMETHEQTLRREFLEELHAPIEIGKLAAVAEIFLPWDGQKCHQIFLCYTVRLLDETVIPLEGIFHGWDDLGGERIDLDFCWVPFEELKSGALVYPPEIVPVILGEAKETAHFVYSEF